MRAKWRLGLVDSRRTHDEKKLDNVRVKAFLAMQQFRLSLSRPWSTFLHHLPSRPLKTLSLPYYDETKVQLRVGEGRRVETNSVQTWWGKTSSADGVWSCRRGRRAWRLHRGRQEIRDHDRARRDSMRCWTQHAAEGREQISQSPDVLVVRMKRAIHGM